MMAARFQFADMELDLQRCELRRAGKPIRLEKMPMALLVSLLEAEGQLVTRQEIINRLWGPDVFVDTEHGINTAVRKLRAALGDDHETPRFVLTVVGRGYRFIKPIEVIAEAGVSDGRLPRMVVSSAGNTAGLAIGAAVLVLLFGLVVWRSWRKSAEPPLPLVVVPLTVLPGKQYSPAFSPDGNQVAFINDDGENSGIYTTIIGGEKPLRITDYGEAPTWSPDGRQIAFLRLNLRDKSSGIYVAPALGGTTRRLYTGPIDRTFMGGLSWSPNGKTLAFAQRDPDDIHAWITLLSLADNSTVRLTSPSKQDHDFIPAFSPDGTIVAFARGSSAGVANDLFVVPAAGGEPQRLTFDNRAIFGLTWTPDGRDVVFSSARGGIAILWRVSPSGGTPQPFAGVGSASSPTISPKGNQLAYQHGISYDAIWRLDLTDEKHAHGLPQLVIGTKGRKARPGFSPDGKKIAFESAEAGNLGPSEIWTCNSDGSNCAPVTSLHGTAGTARWSPDDRYIAFEFRPHERTEIYVVDVGGGPARMVSTLPGADNLAPNWSHDGHWIYFTSNREGGRFQLWKVSATGGDPVPITKNGGVYGIESADARSLYYAKFEVPGIWKMPVRGGQETRVLDQSGGEGWSSWALTPNGIYFINVDTDYHATLAYFEFATRRTFRISAMDKPCSVGLAVAPDGRSILYVQNEFSESNIMLVQNFR